MAQSTEVVAPLHHYCYEPLTDSFNQIRLLSFQEQQGDPAGIHCSLRTFERTSAPQYAAISYAWGDGTAVKEIKVDGKSLFVRQNCWQTLIRVLQHRKTLANFHHFEHSSFDILDPFRPMESSIHYIWIDSICINQEDLSEKSYQVAEMSYTFTRARCVLANIGERTYDSDFLLESMHVLTVDDIWVGRTIHAANEVPLSQSFEPLQRLEMVDPGFQSKIARAVLSWANRSYWSRLWIVPELLVAESLQYLCGDYMIESMDFNLLTKGLENLTTELSDFSHCWSTSLMSSVHHLRGVQWQLHRESWSQLWSRHSTWKCSDPRDRIFAFSSFMPPGCKLKTDYTRSRTQVWIDLVKDEGLVRPRCFPDQISRTASPALIALEIDATHPEINKLVECRRTYNTAFREDDSILKDIASHDPKGFNEDGKIRAEMGWQAVARISRHRNGCLVAMLPRKKPKYSTTIMADVKDAPKTKAAGSPESIKKKAKLQPTMLNFRIAQFLDDRIRSIAALFRSPGSTRRARKDLNVNKSSKNKADAYLPDPLPLAGYMCSEAQAGDMLFPFFTRSGSNANENHICLVMRQYEGTLYEIIGQAIIQSPYSLGISTLRNRVYDECKGELYLDGRDLLAFFAQDEPPLAQVTENGSQLYLQRLVTRFCTSRFSSFGRIHGWTHYEFSLDNPAIWQDGEYSLAMLEQSLPAIFNE